MSKVKAKVTTQQMAQALHHLMWDACRLMDAHDAFEILDDKRLRRLLGTPAAMHTRTLIFFFGAGRLGQGHPSRCSMQEPQQQDIIVTDYDPHTSTQNLSRPLLDLDHDQRMCNFYGQASAQVAHLGVNRVQRRDDAQERKLRWADYRDVKKLVQLVRALIADPGIQNLYKQHANFKNVRRIQVKQFLSRASTFLAKDPHGQGVGDTSNSDIGVVSNSPTTALWPDPPCKPDP